MKNENVIALMAERDKIRIKLIAMSKNKESRSNYNSLILYASMYQELTDQLISKGRKLKISSNLLKVDYWREQYKKFNNNNPNIVMPVNNEIKWDIYIDDKKEFTFTGVETAFKMYYNGIQTAYKHLGNKSKISFKKK